jgi:hypothetical protein
VHPDGKSNKRPKKGGYSERLRRVRWPGKVVFTSAQHEANDVLWCALLFLHCSLTSSAPFHHGSQ